MNINGISNSLVGLQQVAAMLNQHSERTSGELLLEETVEFPPAVAKERPFYEYQEKPWLTDPGYEHFTTREEYVWMKKACNEIYFALTQTTYSRFMKDLADTHPELADKSFGFTLSSSASIKILDYKGSLTEAEKTLLTERINGFDDIKLQLQGRAKAMMKMVDHDHETFGGRFKADINDFEHVIDFGKILSVGVKQIRTEWVRQVSQNAERQDVSRISLSV
ncbi:hypothetical protein [Pseudomonas maioricensis]|uniref:hypothetical protein n=1 Tax=Pseudomonas maioricensis TaxID=1766623 RepID=UPI001FAB8B25|nr:hypothetical protein [Pseudomonas sp. S25]